MALSHVIIRCCGLLVDRFMMSVKYCDVEETL